MAISIAIREIRLNIGIISENKYSCYNQIRLWNVRKSSSLAMPFSQRMFEKNIDEEDIVVVIQEGKVIENYPDDMPHPSRLILGNIGGKPLHLVVAFDSKSGTCYVVTVYHPDPELWEPDFKKRRKA